MKKQLTVMALALSATLVLAGCSWSDVKSKLVGSGGGATVSSSAATGESVVVVEDYDPLKCVTLAEYKGVEVDCTVTEAEYDKKVLSLLQQFGKTEKIKEGKAQKWDTVNVNYVGKVDGKEFDGGSAEDSDITLGEGNYIEDLENGIVGIAIGETKDVNVTFPANYGKKELAGKAAVFTVTVNSITRFKTEFNDKFVKKNTDHKTVEEYKKATMEEAAASKEESAGQTALQTVIDNSTITNMPQTLLQAQKEMMDFYYRYYLSSNYGDEDFATILSNMGMTQEVYDNEVATSAEANTKIILVTEAIAAKEGISVDQSAIDEYINKNVSTAGITGDAYREQYETLYGKSVSFEDFSRTSYIYDKVMELVKSSAVIKK